VRQIAPFIEVSESYSTADDPNVDLDRVLHENTNIYAVIHYLSVIQIKIDTQRDTLSGHFDYGGRRFDIVNGIVHIPPNTIHICGVELFLRAAYYERRRWTRIVYSREQFYQVALSDSEVPSEQSPSIDTPSSEDIKESNDNN
jgi:hypothetical protein